MSRTKKRTRITASENAHSNLTCRPYQYEKRGTYYTAWLVQGWKEDGKAKKKQFAKERDAKAFMALKEVELLNDGEHQRTVLCKLTDEQIQEAEIAFKQLGDTYSLTQAVDFFLKNHRAPDFTISLYDAMIQFLGSREDTVRANTNRSSESVLKSFIETMENCQVHEVTPQQITSYLKSLRAKDGISPAKRKTWNNYRNELNLFFAWASTEDLSSNRPYTFNNPVEKVIYFTAKQVAEEQDEIVTTDIEDLLAIFKHLRTWKDGALVKYYALAYFAGIRPDGELKKLAKHEAEANGRMRLINLKTGAITIPANIAKTAEKRTVTISSNLRSWLECYSNKPIIPPNFDRLNKAFRKEFALSQDETRHSFISYHVALNRSIGDAALQAGNSETIVKKHYFDHRPQEEGAQFFALTPYDENAVSIDPQLLPSETSSTFLKAI